MCSSRADPSRVGDMLRLGQGLSDVGKKRQQVGRAKLRGGSFKCKRRQRLLSAQPEGMGQGAP